MNASFRLSCQSHSPRPRASGFAFGTFLIACFFLGCSRSDTPTPTAVAKATAAPAVASPGGGTGTVPTPLASPGSGKAEASGDFPDLTDWEWDLAEEADGTDFEIDASATSFFMPRGNLVVFKAKALNGTPPFTFSWDFGDGSPHEAGEMVKHKYTTLGSLEVTARGTDASGATSFMQLQILVIHPVAFAMKYQQDEKTIEELKKANPDWQEHMAPAPIVSP